jgi:hypothetical protein
MLAEIAITPSIFDEAVHPDLELWKEQLRELGSWMFPKTGPSPVMISDLFGGSWKKIILDNVKSIKDQKARLYAQDIFKKLSRILVCRPAIGEWPGEDSISWGREAILSNNLEPIDRIIGCKLVHDVISKETRFFRCIDEVKDAGFWNNVESSWQQPMNIKDQTKALRKLCLHSDFLCLITPYIQAGGNDETDFAISIIKSAFTRPQGYSSVEIEIHTKMTTDPSKDPTILINNISNVIRPNLKHNQKVRLVLRPDLLDRYLIVGNHAKLSDGLTQKTPMWGVALNHIAKKQDEKKGTPPTTWTLLNKNHLMELFNRYCCPNPNIINGDIDIIG